MLMKITGVTVRKRYDSGPLKAVLSLTFDNCFALHDVKIVEAGGKEMVVMPYRMTEHGAKDIAHPINKEFRAYIESEIFRSVISNEYHRD